MAVLQQCKYPYVAAEIFCAGRDEIMDTLFRPENELLMDELFAFLQKAAPLDPGVYSQFYIPKFACPVSHSLSPCLVLSGYFSKVVCALLASRSNEVSLQVLSNVIWPVPTF